MKKNFITLTLIAFASLLLTCCKKDNDYNARQGATELKDCQVTKITNDRNGTTLDTLYFTYTSWGDPETVTQLPAQPWVPKMVFKYDKKRRLTDIIGYYPDGLSGNIWHKYFYDNPGKGNITRDSLYIYFEIKNGAIVSHHYRVTYCFYDKYDRIIKDSSFYLSYPAAVQTYVYDADGNLAGGIYDNKTNIHRTNKIWMFFDRDYSVNNPVVADTYNGAGLPTLLNLSFKGPYLNFFMQGLRAARIEYDCRR